MNDIFIKAQAMDASSKASSEFRAVQERIDSTATRSFYARMKWHMCHFRDSMAEE